MRQVATALWIAIFVLVLSTGCSSVGSSSGSPTAPPAEQACPGGSVRPVQVEELIKVFARYGLVMFDDPACVVRSIERQASNMPQYGSDAEGLDRDEIWPEFGSISCTFDAEPLGPLLPVERVKHPEDDETYFSFGNVTCSIYPEGEEGAVQIERLDRAVNDLARFVDRNS